MKYEVGIKRQRRIKTIKKIFCSSYLLLLRGTQKEINKNQVILLEKYLLFDDVKQESVEVSVGLDEVPEEELLDGGGGDVVQGGARPQQGRPQ